VTITATKDLTETLTSTATDIPPTLTPSETPTPEPTSTPTLAPGEVAPLPADESQWNELQEYSTTNEAGEEVRVIIHNGEMIELGRELVTRDGEVLDGFYTWDEITTKLGFDYGIEQRGEKVKMGAYFGAVVLDASKFDDHGWLLVGMEDSKGVMHKVKLFGGNYQYFLQSIDDGGNTQALIDRGAAFDQRSGDLPNNGIEIDLTGYGITMITKVKIKPGNRIGIYFELKGPVNSSTLDRLEEYTGLSYESIQELDKIMRDGDKYPTPKMGEEDSFISTGFVVPAENTE